MSFNLTPRARNKLPQWVRAEAVAKKPPLRDATARTLGPVVKGRLGPPQSSHGRTRIHGTVSLRHFKKWGPPWGQRQPLNKRRQLGGRGDGSDGSTV
jgi:hypothetical protein